MDRNVVKEFSGCGNTGTHTFLIYNINTSMHHISNEYIYIYEQTYGDEDASDDNPKQ